MALREVLTLESLRAMTAPEAAALWLVRQDGDESAGDEEIFSRWLDESIDNAIAWTRARELWELFDGTIDQSLLEQEPAELPAGQPSRWRFQPLALAASIAAMVVGSAMLARQEGLLPSFERGGSQLATKANGAAQGTLFETRLGERRTFELADRSRVTLNTASRIAVTMTPSGRHIELLGGQAFFAVAHDAARPFVVTAADKSVTAVGTRFEVRKANDRFSVILVQGVVRVVADPRNSGSPVELHAGQQLVARSGQPAIVSPADVASVADWQNGVVRFQNVPLSEAVADLNRYSAKPLVVRDRRVAQLRITGVFQTGDSGRFARTLPQIYPVRIIATPDGGQEIRSSN